MGSLRHTLMMGIEKCNSHSGRVWQFLSKLKNALTVWLNDYILVHLSQWNDFFLCRNWYTNVHNSFIYNAKSWKQPRCPSVSEWLNKLWCIYTMNTQQWKGRIYLHATAGMSLKETMLRKSQCQYILHDLCKIYVKFVK